MRNFQKRAPLLILLLTSSLCFLLLQGTSSCVAGAAVSSAPTSSLSSSSPVKHGETAAVHVRKKLLTVDVAAATTLQSAAAAVDDTEEEETTAAAPGECSESAVVVSQDLQAGGLPPAPAPGTYRVTIVNMCLRCTVRDVHVSCGEFGFGLAQLVDPGDFRRVAVGDCLVRGGAALGPGEAVSFRYSSSFQYHLHVASVSCSYTRLG